MQRISEYTSETEYGVVAVETTISDDKYRPYQFMVKWNCILDMLGLMQVHNITGKMRLLNRWRQNKAVFFL